MNKLLKGNKNKVPKITEAQYEEYIQALKEGNSVSSRMTCLEIRKNEDSLPKKE